jgi:uncharacterized membrane protein YphA (DoxX/SURF4 family)
VRPLAYRFVVVYLSVFSVASQILSGLILFPQFSFPPLGTVWPMHDLTTWLGTRVFHVSTLEYRGVSADTPFHWVQLAWIVALSAIAAAVWTAVARRRTSVEGSGTSEYWVRLFFRFALAAQMFYFGMAKVIPTQFPPPPLVTLLKPVGDLTPDDLLWTFMGASVSYQMFTGWAELVAGVLLVVPRTATIGAVIAAADMLQVFVLNMSYDVGLKQTSFHLFAISVFLLWPDLTRIGHALVDRPRESRRSLFIQLAFGVYLLGMFTRLAVLSWYNPGGPGHAKSPLYGIWDVEKMAVDREVRPPMFNDYDRRWRRVIFDTPELMIVERLDDSFLHYGASIDSERHTIALRKIQSRLWQASFSYDRRGDDELTIDGEIDGHAVHVELQRIGMDVFRLTNGSFRWVRPPD